jgi:hypothetical protein
MKTFGRKKGKITGEWVQLCFSMKSGGLGVHLDKRDMHVIELSRIGAISVQLPWLIDSKVL